MKCLSNFWKYCENELGLRCAKNCVISEVLRAFKVFPNSDPIAYQVATQANSATFQINNTKRYVQVITLPINVNIKFLENVKKRTKRTISWNKDGHEIATDTKKKKKKIICLTKRSEILMDCLLFHSKRKVKITREILLINITCHSEKSRILMH